LKARSSIAGKWTGPGSATRRTFLLVGLALLGVILGVASSGLPAKIIFAMVGGAALFVLIYNNIQVGLLLFFVLNLTIPQAGPTANLGMQVAVVGETRGLHFNFHEIVMAMVLVAWLVQVFLKKAEWQRTSPLLLPVVLYVLSAILGSFIGLIHGGSDLIVVFRFTRTVFFAYIFFVFLNNLKTRRQLQQLILALLICSTLVAGFGIVQKVKGEAWTSHFATKYLGKVGDPSDVNYVAGGAGETQSFRINATFLHPNVLGAYIIIALPFFVSLLWFYRERWQRLLLLMGMGVNLGALFYTGSRAAWIAGGVIALLYGVFGFMDKRMILALVTVLLVVAMAIVIVKPPDFVKKRFVSLSAKEAASARMYQYKLAMDFFMEYPIFGLGLGMEGQKINYNNIRSLWAAVENAFLTYLVSTGLFGFTIFLLLFILYLGMMLLARNNSAGDPFMHFHSEAFFMAMIGIIVASQFGAWLLFAIPMWTLFWAFLGMGACLYNMYREESPSLSYQRSKRLPLEQASATQAPAAG
jgi:O-antigen ligase